MVSGTWALPICQKNYPLPIRVKQQENKMIWERWLIKFEPSKHIRKNYTIYLFTFHDQYNLNNHYEILQTPTKILYLTI